MFFAMRNVYGRELAGREQERVDERVEKAEQTAKEKRSVNAIWTELDRSHQISARSPTVASKNACCICDGSCLTWRHDAQSEGRNVDKFVSMQMGARGRHS